jgi:hypothetical protein
VKRRISEYGWNIRRHQPATESEQWSTPREVCLCPLCCVDPHYSWYYCGRLKNEGYIGMLENHYFRAEEKTDKVEPKSIPARIPPRCPNCGYLTYEGLEHHCAA